MFWKLTPQLLIKNNIYLYTDNTIINKCRLNLDIKLLAVLKIDNNFVPAILIRNNFYSKMLNLDDCYTWKSYNIKFCDFELDHTYKRPIIVNTKLNSSIIIYYFNQYDE